MTSICIDRNFWESPSVFSPRTNWHREPNRLSQLLAGRRKSGKPVYDLTITNPPEAGIEYPAEDILSALSHPQSLRYSPDPLGLLSARESVADDYAAKKVEVNPSNILLTASTSEAYSYLFTLLCEARDNILVPTPSYPLFEFLAQYSHVTIHPYQLRYDGEWHVDVDSVKRAISSATKAIVIINPHNPTGMFLKREELERLNEIAGQHNLALIVDEVFAEYAFGPDERRVHSTASHAGVLTFTLNGISKLCGLPQLKLGWIVVSGREGVKNEAMQRLEIIADTFLSVNTPVQVALPRILKIGAVVRTQIQERAEANLSFLTRTVGKDSPSSLLRCEGGWYAILKIPNTKTEEEWALKLLDEGGVYVFPGYFFEFRESGYLVLSLLAQSEVFEKGMEEMIKIIQ